MKARIIIEVDTPIARRSTAVLFDLREWLDTMADIPAGYGWIKVDLDTRPAALTQEGQE